MKDDERERSRRAVDSVKRMMAPAEAGAPAVPAGAELPREDAEGLLKDALEMLSRRDKPSKA